VRPGAVEELGPEARAQLDLVLQDRQEAARAIAAENEEWARAVVERRLTIWPEDGHLGIARHWDEILAALFAA
jgi:hypothetical protein